MIRSTSCAVDAAGWVFDSAVGPPSVFGGAGGSATTSKSWMTTVMLLQLLERRLDNVIYRLGLATSRPQARQLVRHGHFLVNGKKVDVPSDSVRVGEALTIREMSRQTPAILHAIEEVKGRGIPEWLSFDPNGLSGRVVSLPTRDQINLPVQEQLIVELYSK